MPAILILLLVFAATPIVLSMNSFGWDIAVYRNAIHSLQAGHDPYLDAVAVQQIYHAQAVHPAGDPPLSYVYSPLTLPLLRLAGAMPLWLGGSLYGALYLASMVAALWVATLALKDDEGILLCLAPILVYFPGLLANGIVLGGNVAYILYGVTLSAAAWGWQRKSWAYFYLAVLAASCVKAPLLSLVVIPVLSARRQWIPAAFTAAAGLGLFALTPVLCPALFRHYVEAVDDQFLFNHDFGCSPAGLFSSGLFAHGLPYSPGCILFYAAYAIPLFGFLLILSRRYLKGEFTFHQWMPVMLLGVILLNPRLIQYDLAPVTLPLLMIGWRFLRAYLKPTHAGVTMVLLFAITNYIAQTSWIVWKFTEGPILVISLAAGCWTILRPQSNAGDVISLRAWRRVEAHYDSMEVPAGVQQMAQRSEGL